MDNGDALRFDAKKINQVQTPVSRHGSMDEKDTETANFISKSNYVKKNNSNKVVDLNGGRSSYYNDVNNHQIENKDDDIIILNNITPIVTNNSQAVIYTRDPLESSKTNDSQKFNSLRRIPFDENEGKTGNILKTSTMTHQEQASFAKKFKQFDNLLFDHLNREEDEQQQKQNPNPQDPQFSDEDKTKLKSGITFYNGSKYWTLLDNAENDLNPLLPPADSTQIKTSLKRIQFEDDVNVNVRQSKAKAKKVKIKLPIDIENLSKTKLPPRKERTLQKCCLVFFLLIMFIIATGILIYFFVWGFVSKRVTSNIFDW